MLSLQSLSSPLPLSLSSSSSSSLSSNNSTKLIININKTRVRAAAKEKDSEQYEVERDKAKEALQKLDQQFQTLSNKQPQSPKIKASDVKLVRPEVVEQAPEISASFLAYFAGALFIFSIMYNVFFYAVIKPAVDGPRPPLSDPPKERRVL